MSAKPPAKKRSLYDILGVQRDAMAIDIGVAYKKRLAEMERRPGATRRKSRWSARPIIFSASRRSARPTTHR
jgi:hypothetical protein